jgi:hypothetical protein
MGTINLTPPEVELCEAVKHGDSIDFSRAGTGNIIRADVIKHIVVGLPLVRSKSIVSNALGAVMGEGWSEEVWPKTPFGLCIKNAVIDGPLVLDSLTGPVCPLHFEKCEFTDFFSGRNTHFALLKFLDCRFATKCPINERSPVPSIDISGAKVDSSLDMRGVRAASDRLADAEAAIDYFEPRDERWDEDRCWIRLAGARIDGNLDLSRARLRAPPDSGGRLTSDLGVNALDLSLARITGGFSFMNGALARGRIMARGLRLGGDLWMSGASLNGVDGHALMLQLAEIDGLLMLDARADQVRASDAPVRQFRARGMLFMIDLRLRGTLRIDGAQLHPTTPFDPAKEPQEKSVYLSGAIIGGDTEILNVDMQAALEAAPLRCSGDVVIGGSVRGHVDLSGSAIDGTLDISGLRMTTPNSELGLRNGSIGHALRLYSPGAPREESFALDGEADLSGLSCDTLDDDLGRAWTASVKLSINHFTYRRTALVEGRPEARHKPSHRIVGDWFRAKRAEQVAPWRWLPAAWLSETSDFLPWWQHRRNWIFQQFRAGPEDDASTRPPDIEPADYRPQPFEQAIAVARAEGRDSDAIQFEILQQSIEWKHFNQLMRWWLGVSGIVVASLWLIVGRPEPIAVVSTLVALGFTLLLMIQASRLFGMFRSIVGRERKRLAAVFTYVVFFIPAFLILVHFWRDDPLRFLQALFIFAAVRLISAVAHQVMRIGFGYLRRPAQAISTLILAFLIGWLGVAAAETNGMMIIDAPPSADKIDRAGRPGSESGDALLVNVRCGNNINKALYALDVLLPLLDFREESRCRIGRAEAPGGGMPAPDLPPASTIYPAPGSGFGGLVEALPDLTVRNERFWAVLKALYAIAGWFIISLAILTFANIHRTPQPPQ